MGGAWCPNKPISANSFGKEWIQVKFNKSFVITAIETQGRFGGQESVPLFQIEYSRNGGQTWHKWKDFRGSSVSKNQNKPKQNLYIFTIYLIFSTSAGF